MECRQFESSLYSNPSVIWPPLNVPQSLKECTSCTPRSKPENHRSCEREKDHSLHRSLGSLGRKQSHWRVTSSHASNKRRCVCPHRWWQMCKLQVGHSSQVRVRDLARNRWGGRADLIQGTGRSQQDKCHLQEEGKNPFQIMQFCLPSLHVMQEQLWKYFIHD